MIVYKWLLPLTLLLLASDNEEMVSYLWKLSYTELECSFKGSGESVILLGTVFLIFSKTLDRYLLVFDLSLAMHFFKAFLRIYEWSGSVSLGSINFSLSPLVEPMFPKPIFLYISSIVDLWIWTILSSIFWEDLLNLYNKLIKN